jgi:hypothetical protein
MFPEFVRRQPGLVPCDPLVAHRSRPDECAGWVPALSARCSVS